jgi:two-component system response regulator MtrA
MLPGAFGLDVLKHLRTQSDVPVLVLSAKTDATVKVRALDMGADDYLIKPFWPEELVARVNARLRRPSLQRSGSIEARRAQDRRRSAPRQRQGRARRAHPRRVRPARRARAPSRGRDRARWLCENVLDPEREGTERTLDVHVSRLRKKLGPCGDWISTVWGVGYRLEVAGRHVKLRTRLALIVLVTALPVVAAITWTRADFEHRTIEQGLRDFVLTRMENGGRECARPRPRPSPSRPAVRADR